MSEKIVTVYATFANHDDARRIARLMVEERLAACVNILAPCHSIYRWQGKVEEADEIPVLFKTRADAASRLVARVAELHPYDVPAAMVWPIAEAVSAYAAWVVSETIAR